MLLWLIITIQYSSIDTHSRVPLLTNSGGSDYINANFITVTMVINSGRSDNINANFHTVSMVQLTGVHNSKRRVPFSYYYGLLKEFTNTLLLTLCVIVCIVNSGPLQ